MAKKGFKKQKAGSQTAKQRKAKPQGGGGGASSTSSGGGAMSGFRRGLQLVAGTSKKKGPKTAVEKIFDIILWIAVIAAGFYFVSKQCA